VDVVVDVRSRECEDEWMIGMGITESNDRLVATACVERDEEVGFALLPGFEDVDAMPQISKYARPSERGYPVAFTGTRRRWGYDVDFHRVRVERLTTKTRRTPREPDRGEIEVVESFGRINISTRKREQTT
jgi:hypothetical protein